MQTVRLAPSNSIVFISDVEGGDAPISDRPDWVMSTGTCISVCTLAEVDGETSISLAHRSDIRRADPPAYDGVLETPKGQVVVSVVDGSPLLEGSSGSARTRITIWASNQRNPDEIAIGYERVSPVAAAGSS